MAKNTDIQRRLDSIRSEMCALHDRRDELNAIAKERGIQRFEDANGCNRCRGRGWVVTWDTMDFLDGSAADYGDCPEKSCTPETRKASGLYPENTRYDHNRYATWAHFHDLTEAERDEWFGIEPQIIGLNKQYNDTEMSARPTKGKLVEVVAKARSRNSAAVGVVGKVFWYGCNDWGTVKVGIMDIDGDKHYTTEKSVTVLKQQAGKEYDPTYDDQYPLLCKVVRKSNKAICVMTPGQSPFSGGEWIPWSQVLNADQVREQISGKALKDGAAATVMLPPWLAKKRGYLRE
jgi:hypothetical protein